MRDSENATTLPNVKDLSHSNKCVPSYSDLWSMASDLEIPIMDAERGLNIAMEMFPAVADPVAANTQADIIWVLSKVRSDIQELDDRLEKLMSRIGDGKRDGGAE